jgi:hypothetical protein
MWHTPDDLVGHSGNVVAMVLHVIRTDEGRQDENAQQQNKCIKLFAGAFYFAVSDLLHGFFR